MILKCFAIISIEQNEHFNDRPRIKLIMDRFGKAYDKEILIDLLESEDISIEYAKEQ